MCGRVRLVLGRWGRSGVPQPDVWPGVLWWLGAWCSGVPQPDVWPGVVWWSGAGCCRVPLLDVWPGEHCSAVGGWLAALKRTGGLGNLRAPKSRANPTLSR